MLCLSEIGMLASKDIGIDGFEDLCKPNCIYHGIDVQIV